MKERFLAIPCYGLCVSPNGTSVGLSSHRLTHITFLGSIATTEAGQQEMQSSPYPRHGYG
jgi:hypothetical protein